MRWMSAVFRCTWPMSTPGSIGRGPCSTGVRRCVVVSFMSPLYLRTQALVHCLATLTHGHVFRDAPRPRLGPFGVLQLVQDRVAVRARQAGEELGGPWIRIELGLEIVGHRRGRGRVVGGVPAT